MTGPAFYKNAGCAPSVRELEAALRWLVTEHAHDYRTPGGTLLARAAEFRRSAREARPVVVEWIDDWLEDRGKFHPWCAIVDALARVAWMLDRRDYKPLQFILAAYDCFLDAAPPPDGEPPEVADLVLALARMAVREMEARR